MITKVMVDLETMGNYSDAAIVSIGAVKFNSEGIYDNFYTAVSLETSLKVGLTITPSTVLWWLQQSDKAREAIVTAEAIGISQALIAFSKWVLKDSDVENIELWGNGAAFDNVILRSAYQKCGMPEPWVFYNDRCYRTIKNMLPDIKHIDIGTHHNALDDAIYQALHLIKIMKAIGNQK